MPTPAARTAFGHASVTRLTLLTTLALSMAPAWARDEVPFITTPDHVTLAMLQLAGVGAQDVVLDLGSGDGRIPITAARRFGARGLGVEIVPELVDQSRANARRAGVADRVDFRVQDLFATDLSVATVITMYLLPEVDLALRPRLLALKPGTRIVSHDWDLGDWRPDRTLTLDVPDKPVGREKLSRLHRWTVPAPVGGLWCSPGGWSLRIEQHHQQVSASLQRPGDAAPLAGRIDGTVLHLLSSAGAASWNWQAGQPARLTWQQGRLPVEADPAAATIPREFTATAAATCPA